METLAKKNPAARELVEKGFPFENIGTRSDPTYVVLGWDDLTQWALSGSQAEDSNYDVCDGHIVNVPPVSGVVRRFKLIKDNKALLDRVGNGYPANLDNNLYYALHTYIINPDFLTTKAAVLKALRRYGMESDPIYGEIERLEPPARE